MVCHETREVVELCIEMWIHVVDLVGDVLGVEQIKDGFRAHLLGGPVNMPDGSGGDQIQAIGLGFCWSWSKPSV